MTVSTLPSQQLEKLATLCSKVYEIFVLSVLGT